MFVLIQDEHTVFNLMRTISIKGQKQQCFSYTRLQLGNWQSRITFIWWHTDQVLPVLPHLGHRGEGLSLCAECGLYTNCAVQTAALCQVRDGSSDECTSRGTSWWQRRLDAAQRNQMTPYCPRPEQCHLRLRHSASLISKARLCAAVTEGGNQHFALQHLTSSVQGTICDPNVKKESGRNTIRIQSNRFRAC